MAESLSVPEEMTTLVILDFSLSTCSLTNDAFQVGLIECNAFIRMIVKEVKKKVACMLCRRNPWEAEYGRGNGKQTSILSRKGLMDGLDALLHVYVHSRFICFLIAIAKVTRGSTCSHLKCRLCSITECRQTSYYLTKALCVYFVWMPYYWLCLMCDHVKIKDQILCLIWYLNSFPLDWAYMNWRTSFLTYGTVISMQMMRCRQSISIFGYLLQRDPDVDNVNTALLEVQETHWLTQHLQTGCWGTTTNTV